jgi:hypothetical protein
MFNALWLAFGSLVRLFRHRRDLILENFVLRQQLAVLKWHRPRPALHLFDKVQRDKFPQATCNPDLLDDPDPLSWSRGASLHK